MFTVGTSVVGICKADKLDRNVKDMLSVFGIVFLHVSHIKIKLPRDSMLLDWITFFEYLHNIRTY